MDRENENSISLGDIFRVLKKNIILILIITLAITLAGGIYTFGIAHEIYTSTATVIVATTSSSSSDNVNISDTYRTVKSVAEVSKNDLVLTKVAEDNNMKLGTLKSMVTTSYSTDSFLIYISVTDEDNLLTEKLANEISANLIETFNTKEELQKFNVKLIEASPAKQGTYTSPNKKLYVAVSFLLGLIVSFVVVFIIEFASNKYKTREEIMGDYAEPVIGVYIDDKKKKNKDKKRKYVSFVEPKERNFEQFNKLFSNIVYANLDHPYQVIMNTSSVEDELKSTISLNLSQIIARDKHSVILIDLDLRRPVLHRPLNQVKEVGLVQYIEGSMSLDEIIKHCDNNIDLITIGKSILNPMVVLESKHLATLIEELRKKYDYIIIDTPPLMACSDAIVISKLCDGVIFNVSMNQVHKKVAKESYQTLKNVGANIIGINITKAQANKRQEYYYYYYNNYSTHDIEE